MKIIKQCPAAFSNYQKNLPVIKKDLKCNLCANKCQISLGERGYCGLRINEELAEKVDARTSCICYFGGDPSPSRNRQMLENFRWAALLAFYPNFYFYNLPTTSRRHAEECFRVARDAGFKNVHLGNIHLLSNDY